MFGDKAVVVGSGVCCLIPPSRMHADNVPLELQMPQTHFASGSSQSYAFLPYVPDTSAAPPETPSMDWECRCKWHDPKLPAPQG